MADPRFILQPPSTYSEAIKTVELRDSEHHHLTRVLRLSSGADVEVIDYEKKLLLAGRVTSSSREVTSILVTEANPIHSPQPITAIVGVPERATADFLVEKLTEIGVSRIAFFIADRSQGGKSRFSNSATERWSRIVLSAVKQSRTPHLPSLHYKESLSAALFELYHPSDHLGIIALTGSESMSNQLEVRSLLELISQEISAPFGTGADATSSFKQNISYADLLYVVGPEGGLTESEAEQALSVGFKPITLGSSVLRVETAALLTGGLLRMASCS